MPLSVASAEWPAPTSWSTKVSELSLAATAVRTSIGGASTVRLTPPEQAPSSPAIPTNATMPRFIAGPPIPNRHRGPQSNAARKRLECLFGNPHQRCGASLDLPSEGARQRQLALREE